MINTISQKQIWNLILPLIFLFISSCSENSTESEEHKWILLHQDENEVFSRDIDRLLTIPMVFLKFLVSDFPKSSFFRKIVDNQSHLS